MLCHSKLVNALHIRAVLGSGVAMNLPLVASSTLSKPIVLS